MTLANPRVGVSGLQQPPVSQGNVLSCYTSCPAQGISAPPKTGHPPAWVKPGSRAAPPGPQQQQPLGEGRGGVLTYGREWHESLDQEPGGWRKLVGSLDENVKAHLQGKQAEGGQGAEPLTCWAPKGGILPASPPSPQIPSHQLKTDPSWKSERGRSLKPPQTMLS